MDFQDNPQSILTFRVGPVLCCAPSLPVRSIITPPKLTHPPGSDHSQPGIFRHGSHIVKVIDLRQKFGIDPSEQTDPGHLIITVFDEESFAFWVDQILDVFDFPAEGWGSIPLAIPRGIFTRTLLIKKQIHLYADFIKLTKLNDLGYLKHYIQQLKLSAQKDSTVATGHTMPVTAESNHSTKNNTVSAAAVIHDTALQADKIQTRPDMASAATHTETTPALTATTKPAANISTPNKSLITEKEPINIVNTDQSRTQEQTKITQVQKSIIRPALAVQDKSRVSAEAGRPAFVSTVTASAAKPLVNNTKTLIEEKTHTVKHSPSSELNAETENESSFAGILLLIFIFLMVVGVIVYMLLPSSITKHKQPEPPVIDNTIEIPVYHAETIEQNTFKSDPVEIIPQNSQEDVKPELQIPPAYRAEISHSEDEITITIHKPSMEKTENKILTESLNVIEASPVSPAENNISEDRVSEIKDEPQIATQTTEKNQESPTEVKSISIEPLKQNELIKTLPEQKNVEEVIHIVVKGDTLWAIAKKYVNDPFLYPELARLSHIKNPHRIYPGNRVRIRFVKD